MPRSPGTSAEKAVSPAVSAAKPPLLRRYRWLLAVVAVAILAGVVWNEVLKYRFIAKRWGTVVPGKVYRSGQISQHMLDTMIREHKLEVIVDLNGVEENDPDQEYEILRTRQLGIELHRFGLGGDGTGDARRYADAVAMIDKCAREGRPVLVHCSAGAQRTGGVIAAYRILVQGYSPEAAFREMEDYGWRPHRDLELLPYLEENLPEVAAMLHERGVIDEVPADLSRGDQLSGLAN